MLAKLSVSLKITLDTSQFGRTIINCPIKSPCITNHVNWKDDNTLSVIQRSIQIVLIALKIDAENGMDLFKDNLFKLTK